MGGAQGLEGRVPGVGQHDEPDHPRHQGVVDEAEDDDTRQSLGRPGWRERERERCLLTSLQLSIALGVETNNRSSRTVITN